MTADADQLRTALAVAANFLELLAVSKTRSLDEGTRADCAQRAKDLLLLLRDDYTHDQHETASSAPTAAQVTVAIVPGG